MQEKYLVIKSFLQLLDLLHMIKNFRDTTLNILLLPSTGHLSEYIKPGLVFDCNLSFELHITKLAFKGIWFDHKDKETILHAFISAHLDYCNNLLTSRKTDQLQTGQNSAARQCVSELTLRFFYSHTTQPTLKAPLAFDLLQTRG